MSSNYAFVASLSTSPPGNNFVGLVVVPKKPGLLSTAAAAAVVLSGGVSREKQKPAHFVVLWRNNNTFFCNIGIHILQQRYILHHTAYWFAILIIFAGKKVK